MIELRTVNLTRYITPLREGGSLPALAEADDEFKYVVKFRGAGHGTKALISELIGGEVAHILGFRVPELVFLNLDEAFGRTEGDEEIQDLLQGSRGLNLGLHFLSGALTFDPVATKVDPELASRIVWLDAYLTNIDRTFRNTNMLMWHKELWLIDHGASLYFHHSWENWEKHAVSPFTYIKNHVLPDVRKAEYIREYGLNSYDAERIINDLSLAEFFEEAVKLTSYPKQLANMLVSDAPQAERKVSSKNLAALCELAGENRINSSTAKKLLRQIWETDEEPVKIVEEQGLEQINDERQIEAIARKVMAQEQKSVADYRQGKKVAAKAVIGKVMAAMGGRGNPLMVNEIVYSLLDGND